MRIDERRYTKAQAWKGKSRIAKFLWRSGACSMYYDHPYWELHFWWWHPLTWLLFVANVAWFGLSNVGEIQRELFLPRRHRKYQYRRAPLN